MFSFTTLLIGVLITTVFVKLDGPQIVTHTAVTKYKKFRSLNDLVSTRYKNLFTILAVSIWLIIKAMYYSFLQWSDGRVKRIDKSTFEVTYMIQGKLYKMLVVPRRGPRDILAVINEENVDVTADIFPYAGPREDFHGGTFTPSFFGYQRLIFECSDGSEKHFRATDPINIYPLNRK